MNKCFIETLAMQSIYIGFKRLTDLSFQACYIASVVHIVMAQCYKGYMYEHC